MHLYTVRDECKALLESQASPELVEEVAKFTGLDGVLRAALAPPPRFYSDTSQQRVGRPNDFSKSRMRWGAIRS